jgi:DNA-binding CsgD family transcriptional regulator/sugar-specific transcriptional regulator TrmB
MCTKKGETGATGPVELCEDGLAAYRRAVVSGTMTDPVPPCLLDAELARPLPVEPGVYVPVPPDVALDSLQQPAQALILRERERMRALAEALAPAQRLYQQAGRQALPAVRLLRGLDVINDTLRQLNTACRQELQAAQPGGPRPQFILEETRPQLRSLLDRGVRHRTLYQHTVRTHAGTVEFMAEVHAAGGRFRTADALPGRMIIYDRSVAVVPDSRFPMSHHALLVEHPGLALFLADVFDHAWDQARPVDFASSKAPAALTEEKRRTVLRLMVEGHTDAAIATRLGMSPRTVAHHIKKASEAYGSRSRAQLAYLLARHAPFVDEIT